MKTQLSRFLVRIVLSILIIISSFGCGAALRKAAQSKVAGITSTVDAASVYDQVSADSSQALKNQEFAKLEASANAARQGKERLVGGYWKLRAIYRAFESPNFKQNAADLEWQAHIARLESWKKEMPNSITARVALASAWLSYGVQARGEGYANTVSDANRKLFESRTQLAYEELNAARSLEPKCPEWYSVMLNVGQMQGWTRAKYDEVFEAGFALEPTYYPMAISKELYLLPQWYENPASWRPLLPNILAESRASKAT